MREIFLFIVVTIAIKASAQVSPKQPSLSPAAKIIFKNVKTKLTNDEKNFFAKGVYIQTADKTKLTVDEHGEDQGAMAVEIYPTDLNKDSIEEIFIRTSGTFFGQWLPDLNLYIKNKNGKYLLQEGVSAPRLYVHATGFDGYPDLIGGLPEGPGFDKPKGGVDTYRWDGNKYKLYKKSQASLKTDKSIEEVISPAYVKTLTANAAGNDVTTTQSKKEGLAANGTKTKNETIDVTPMAEMLFSGVKTKLSNAEKNDLVHKTGISAADTMAKTKKGKSKITFAVYPTDLNNDGTEEIFLEVTTTPIGIPLHNFYFYAKDFSGTYQPLPGKIGQGVKMILNGKSGYPDLINGLPGLGRQIWSWDGTTYRLQQTTNSSTNIQYRTKDIDKASMEYTGR
ncbi:MAG: hypothetical protein ABIO55_16185 [Ginsengibacter sp.]